MSPVVEYKWLITGAAFSLLSTVIKAHAKINLTLDILYKRPDGYHELETVMQSIELHDILELTRTGGEITFSADSNDVPTGPRNLAWQAAALLKAETGCRFGVRIKLKKFIPIAAGLGGGSADAAAVLAGLNRIWELDLSKKELAFIGGKIGSDVPFCIYGGAALARGRGELVTPLKQAPVLSLVLVKPPFGLSTAEVYRKFSEGGCRAGAFKRVDTEGMVRAVELRDGFSVALFLANALEPVVVEMKPEIAVIKEKLLYAGALGALMSGSGPTVFGVFESYEQAQRAAAKLGEARGNYGLKNGANINTDIFVTRTLGTPPEFEENFIDRL